MNPNFKIAKVSYTTIVNGVKVKKLTKNYYGRITLPNGQRKRIPLTTDRRTSQTMLGELVRKHQTGELSTDDLTGRGGKKSLLQYLEDYVQHISFNHSVSWAKSQASKLRRLFKLTGAIFPNDMTYSKAVNVLKEMKEKPTGKMKKGLSLNTINNNIACYKAFFNWLVNTDQIPKNPLRRLVKSRVTETDLVHPRRQMTLEEQEFLVATIRSRDKVTKELISPQDRAMLYQIALMTGIRSKELFSMTKESFDLEAGTFTIEAEHAKARRKDTLPLHPQLVEILKDWLSLKTPGQRLWAGSYHAGRAAKLLKKDMEYARQQYIQEASNPAERQVRENSDFLKWCDSNNKFSDFHSTKTTFINNLMDANVPIRDAQILSRHRDPSTTLNHYAKTTTEKLRGTVCKVPRIGIPDKVAKAPDEVPAGEKVTSKVVLESECLPNNHQTINLTTTDGILFPEGQSNNLKGAGIKKLGEILRAMKEMLPGSFPPSDGPQPPAETMVSVKEPKSCPNLAQTEVICFPEDSSLISTERVWKSDENPFYQGKIEGIAEALTSVPDQSRTDNLWLRRPTLYPIELRGLIFLIINNSKNYSTN